MASSAYLIYIYIYIYIHIHNRYNAEKRQKRFMKTAGVVSKSTPNLKPGLNLRASSSTPALALKKTKGGGFHSSIGAKRDNFKSMPSRFGNFGWGGICWDARFAFISLL
jgi:hypothetical protein